MSITVIGRKNGNIVAQETVDSDNDAARVAKQFRDAGLEVEVRRE